MGSSDAWTDHALTVLASEGYRSGGARSAIVEFLGREGGCLTAEDVVARLREEDAPAGSASVYRALNLLCELGLLHRATVGEGPPRFDLVHPGEEEHHHHHIVCDHCGQTVTFADPRLEAAIDEVSRRVGYVVDSHDVILRGACADCARLAPEIGAGAEV